MDRERIIDLFLCGKLPRFDHARHVAVAKLLRDVPNGRELMHLGLQITATRAGVPWKYSREITDRCWDALDAGPVEHDFEDVTTRSGER